MLPTDEQLKDLKNADAGLMAMEITGKYYKEDEETSKLMCGLHMMLGRARSNAFAAVDDTHWHISFEEALRIARGEGFKEIARFDVNRLKYGTSEVEDVDTRIILYSSDGFYLNVDSYRSGDKKIANGIHLSYTAELDREVCDAILHSADESERWELANPNWWSIRDERPKTTTKEEDELWMAFVKNCRGNFAWNWEDRMIYCLSTDRHCLEGLRLTLSELRKQTSWKIHTKLHAWEWYHAGFQSAPRVGYEPHIVTREDGTTYESFNEIRMSDEEWFEQQLAALPEEHQYLRDLPVCDDISNYSKKQREALKNE